MLELLFVALFQAGAGEPQVTPPASPTPQAEEPTIRSGARVDEDEDPDAIVCRNVVRTGSRMPVRRCLSRRDQEQVRTDSQDRLRDQIRNTMTIQPPGG